MALRRPRRIFRGSSLASSSVLAERLRPAVLVGVLCAAIAGGVALMGVPSDLFGRVPAVSGTLMAAASAVAVVDGETLRLRETVVHLQGVAAPARGSVCGAGDCGAQAADALAGLVRGRDISCRLDGRNGEGFVQGICEAAGTELNRALVAAGWARAEGKSEALALAEQQARMARLGVWRGGI